MSEDEEKLSKIEQKMKSLRERLDGLEAEAEKWREERDRLNELVKEMRAESLKHREERNSSNSKVADIKKKIESLRDRVREKRAYLEREDAKLDEERGRLPHRRNLAEKLSGIEWEIMTTPTLQMIDREKDLMDEAKGLEEGLTAHHILDQREDEEMDTYADIKALEVELRSLRNEIDRQWGLGNDSHEKMILLREKADEEKKRADEAHTRFKEQLEAKKIALTELNEVKKQASELRLKLGEIDRSKASERGKTLEERRRELQAEAKSKLEAGKKLSLEELKLIYEDKEDEEE